MISMSFRLAFSRFLGLRGNLGIVTEKPTRKSCLSCEKKDRAARIYHAKVWLTAFI